MEPVPAKPDEELKRFQRLGPAVKKVLSYVACWALWAFSAALAFFTLFMVGRGMILRMSAETISKPYARGIYDKFGVLIFGLVWLGFAIFSEQYYRRGVREHKLLKRFGRVTAVELCVLAVVGAAFLLLTPD